MPALQEISQLAALLGAHAWAVGDCICCSIHCPADALTAKRPFNHCMAACCLPLHHDVHHSAALCAAAALVMCGSLPSVAGLSLLWSAEMGAGQAGPGLCHTPLAALQDWHIRVAGALGQRNQAPGGTQARPGLHRTQLLWQVRCRCCRSVSHSR